MTGDWNIYWVFTVCMLDVGLRTIEGIHEGIKHFHKNLVSGEDGILKMGWTCTFFKIQEGKKYVALRSMTELSKYTKSPTYAVINKDWFCVFLQWYKSTTCS